MVVHPDWDPQPFTSDVALLELAAPVALPVRRLVVPGQQQLAGDGAEGTVVGWGSVSTDQRSPEYPDELREATLPVLSDEDCRAAVGGYLVDRLMVCAGAGTSSQTAADTCQGDSGGPLLVPDPRGGTRQAGVTSFGATCGNTPTVYAEVAAFHPWLEATTGADLNTFSDTGRSVHEAAVEQAALLSVVNGFSDGTFAPLAPVRRDQAASMVARAAGVTPTPEDAEGGFSDVDATHRAAINALVRLGVVQGRDADTFRPRDPLRRDQLASLLARALALPGDEGVTFSDVPAGSTHAGAVGALAGAGVVNGYPDGTFLPERSVDRGQVAALLSRSFLADGEVGPPPPASSR